ncbi:A disintegrin and metalloproteinase with thrombospondin motifs 6-like [Centruroides sculpturatus]|uniref:A disintegrin and metalloproteinase with thrombospondin motifs 6-like n=1 Tax=Centruroides sculpturatus TaxID=218467 RepID=UPI000C6CE435|nr:A disintegrin and metalloproteinase with thrombospondin motifs 6-like [Centruroides sculpturatus]
MNCAKWIWLTILIIGVVMATDLISLRTAKLGDTLSLLDSYEVFIPTVVDSRGQFLSYDVRHNQLKKRLPIRHKRTVSSFPLDPVFFKIKLENKEYLLNLTENSLLSGRNSILEVWHPDSIEKRNFTYHKCHYYGHVIGEENFSDVMISNCYGLHGIFSISGQEYVIEPYWNHTNDVLTQGHPHILYKRTSLDFKRKFKGDSKGCSSEKRIRRRRVKRRKRSVITERYVETLVVADKKAVAYHGEEEIETYILTIMNIVAKLFRDPSLGNAVNIIVNRIILLKEKQPNLLISHHAGQTLSSFCKWQESIKRNENAILSYSHNHHDNAILITRYDICFDKDEPCDTLGLAQVSGMCERGRSCSINQDIGLTSGFTIAHELGHKYDICFDKDEPCDTLGLAQVSGMCERGRSCSINQDIGLTSGFTIAHELGHNFGMQHDGSGNDCLVKINEPGYIMSTQLSRLVYPVKWSRCSRQYITDFFDSGQGDCLQNVPPMNDYAYTDLLPGQRYNADQQCRSQFGPHSSVCQDIQREVCGTLWCSKHKGRCVSNNTPLLDGTVCNSTTVPNGWCYGGECVDYGTIPSKVDGGWGQWSEWGVCSRKCGGGIETSERQCDKPRPSHGGRFCVGKRKRYRSCNVKGCPSNSEDFRAMQCRKFNNIKFRGKYYQWIPFTADQVNSCSLYCQAVGYNFYVEQAVKVIDGTRCNQDSLDVCINGRCMPVGCDGILNSKVTEDRCRKCGGDGSTCRTRRGLLESSLDNKVNCE